METGAQGARHSVEGGATLLPRLHVLAVGLPEVGGQLKAAGIEQVCIIDDLVVEVVLGPQAHGMGLDANVDVFGDQDNLALRILGLECTDHTQNEIVGLEGGQSCNGRHLQLLGLEIEPSGGIAVANAIQSNAAIQMLLAA